MISACRKSSTILLALLIAAPALATLHSDSFDDVHAATIVDKSASEIGVIQKDAALKPPEKAAQIGERKAQVDGLVRKFPDSPDVQGSGARASLQLGDVLTAVTRASLAVKLARHKTPRQLAEALKTRAIALVAEGDYGGAFQDASQALKLFPGDRNAMILAGLTRDRKAGRAAARAASIAAGAGAATEAAGAPALIAGRPNGALQHLIDAARDSAAINRPAGFEDSVGETKQAENSLKLGDYDAMYAKASAAVKAMPDNPKVYMQRAFAGLMLKRYDDVVADATRGLTLAPKSSSLLALRAAAYGETGRADLAWTDAENAVADDPKDAFAVLQRGLAGEKIGKPADATLTDIRAAGELDPSFAHFYTDALARRGMAAGDGSGQKPAADLAPSYPTASRRPAALAGLCSLLICAGIFFLLGRLWKDEPRS